MDNYIMHMVNSSGYTSCGLLAAELPIQSDPPLPTQLCIVCLSVRNRSVTVEDT